MRSSLRHGRALLVVLLALTAAAGAVVACSSDDDVAPGGDAGGGDGSTSRPDGATAPGDDAGGADACAAPDAGEGKGCDASAECACNTTCAGNRCVRRASCDEALLSWDGPTSNLDGTCTTNLAGFKVYYGTTMGGPYTGIDAGRPCVAGPMIPCGDAGQALPQAKCAYRVGPLDAGTWYFTVSAYTDAGVESPVSSEVSKTIACP